MAQLIVNSTQDKAVRKTEVVAVSIEDHDGGFALVVKITNRVLDVVFETDETLDGIKAKAADFIAAMNAA